MRTVPGPSTHQADKRKLRAVVIGASIALVIFAIAGSLWLLVSFLSQTDRVSRAATPPSLSSNIQPTSTITPAPEIPTPSITNPPPTISDPSLTSTSSVPATATPTIYIVQEGDTLTAIAGSYGTTVEILMAANNLTNDTIYAGQPLVIAWELHSATVVAIPVSPDPAQTVVATAASTLPASPASITVAPADTLDLIAAVYGVDAEAIRRLNYMVGDALFPGQTLYLPAAGELPSLPTYQFSILEGNLTVAYPESWDAGRFTLHYASDTYASLNPQIIANLVQNALNNDEYLFQATLPYHFDVYAAGSLFEPPNRALRGRSFSAALRTFFLHDGTGNATDQQYITAHELTHLYSWNVFGTPVSVMLSEGAATYAGMHSIAGLGYLPLGTFCAAYAQVDALPHVSSALGYNGHNIDLENYYAAGCFVGYLIEMYGAASFGQLYPTANYEAIYGASLVSLEADWQAYTANLPVPGWLDASALVAQVDAVTSAYAGFFPAFTGTPLQLEAYRLLDLARLALLEARLSDSAAYLQAFYAILD